MTTVDCPVCGKTDLADHLVQCPQCNADLECFRLLDALYEVPPTPDVPSTAGASAEAVGLLSRRLDDIGPVLHHLQDGMHQWQRAAVRRTALLILAIVMFGVVLAVGVWRLSWSMPQAPVDVRLPAALAAALANERPPEKALREALDRAVASIEQVRQQVVALEQRVANLVIPPAATAPPDPAVAASEPESSWLVHEPRKSESLWLLAQRYYQQGLLYPAILETNPGLGIYFDPDDGQLRLPPNRQAAEAIVARVVFTKDAKRFLRYQVQVADTWQNIAERFYGSGGNAAWLQALNAEAQPQPGTRVVVPLFE